MAAPFGRKLSEETKRKIGLGQLKENGHSVNWKGGLSKLVCKTCNNDFYVRFGRRNEAQYCSMKCRQLPDRRGVKRPQTTGSKNGNWRGGATKNRDLFYTSIEWRMVCESIYDRENYKCKRCSVKKKHGLPFHVHHIKPYRYTKTRLDPLNLVLLCKPCHNFVHSKLNNELLWIAN